MKVEVLLFCFVNHKTYFGNFGVEATRNFGLKQPLSRCLEETADLDCCRSKKFALTYRLEFGKYFYDCESEAIDLLKLFL